jgi:Domain of unknown function (DUF4258)
MAKRSISRTEVEEVVANPQITYPSSQDPGRTILVRTIGERRIKIVVPNADPEFVISAMDQTEED